ncbi:MAG: molecular chaperone TorD family protein [Magnetospirillum sp. WYHS-4]
MDGSMDQAIQSPALGRARLYHFLELALAHPAEDGFDHFRREATEKEFVATLLGGARPDEALAAAVEGAAGFFAGLRRSTFFEVETAHIGLFSANFPQVPCPPYGSLFTAADESKRLEEMLAIKHFYQENGVDIAENFDDLPDHLCVELEFLQLLCFRENDAVAEGDGGTAAGARMVQAEFLDRFLLPFTDRLSRIAVQAIPDNPYSQLLAATHRILAHHRRSLGEQPNSPSQHRESQP